MDFLYIPVIILHLSIVAKKAFYCNDDKLRSLKLLIAKKFLCCIYYTLWIDWFMSFGLEQEGGSLITPMALAHPLHPINSRSRNKCRNLWVGRCVSSRWPLFLSRNFVLICIYIYTYAFLIRILVIRRINKYTGSVVQYWWSCTLSQSIGLYWGSARFLCWMPLFDFFGVTHCVLFYD